MSEANGTNPKRRAIPYETAIELGICGALHTQRDTEPCHHLRDGRLCECPRHCSAKLKGGLVCSQAPVRGAVRCGLHGGRSPRGLNHPRWKDGSKSRYVPRGNLAEKYNEAFDAGAYTEQREEITLTTAMINEVLGEQSEATGALFKALRRAWVEAEQARDAGDGPRVAAKLEVVGRLIERGTTSQAQREEAVKLMDHRRKLVDSETRRLERERQMLTLEQVMMRDMVIMEVLKEMLDDGQLARIRGRLQERMRGRK